MYEAWSAAFRAKNVDAVLALLTDDYVLWAPGQPALGRNELRQRLETTFAAYDLSSVFEREEQVLAGDWAFERGWDIQTARGRLAGVTQTHRQRVFLVLRCGADGEWRFARGMSQPGPG